VQSNRETRYGVTNSVNRELACVMVEFSVACLY
jgi:hypothetical protein